MIAALAFVALLIELGAYGAAAAWLRHAAGVPVLASGLVAAFVFIALRVAVVAVSCALARRWRAATSVPLAPAEFLQQVARETRAFLRLFVLAPVLQAWLAPRDPDRTVQGVAPVLLVHGLYCNAGVWQPQLVHLRQKGVANLFCINLGPPLASIDVFARQLDERVDEVRRACGTSKVIIVAHSLGGLAARAWCARLGGSSRLARLVTIGTPHHGSRLAPLVVGTCAAEMVPGSEWLLQLEADERRAPALPLTCILSRHDSMVAPQDSALLAGASVLALDRLGHFDLLLDPVVHRQVASEIAAARSGCPS
ncbi:MAG TPA: alpha/beta fold hydrolase [Burkholderiales bacterium]